MPRLAPFFCLVWVLVTLTVAAPAARAESPWQMRVNFLGLDHGAASSQIDAGGDTVTLDAGLGFGVALNWERRMSRWIGLDLGVAGAIEDSADVRIDIQGGSNGVDASSLIIAPLSIGVNVHPLQPESRLDLYFGPQIALVQFASFDVDIVTTDGNSDARVDLGAASDFALGAVAGLDVDLGKPDAWSFNFGFRYLDTSIDEWDVSISTGAAGSVELDYDPLIFGIGWAYRSPN